MRVPNIALKWVFHQIPSMENTSRLQEEIRKLDEQICQLQKERAKLIRMRSYRVAEEQVGNLKRVTAASRGKMNTLGHMSIVLSNAGRPLNSAQLINGIRSFDESTNETTLRSHFRRLRDEKLVEYDKKSGKWSLPKKSTAAKD